MAETYFRKLIVMNKGNKFYFPDEDEGRPSIPLTNTLQSLKDYLKSQGEEIRDIECFLLNTWELIKDNATFKDYFDGKIDQGKNYTLWNIRTTTLHVTLKNTNGNN